MSFAPSAMHVLQIRYALKQRLRLSMSFLKEVYADTDSATFINDTTIAFVEVTALGTDSIFVVQDTTFSLTLPLNAAASQVEYFFKTVDIFEMSGEVTNTLQIGISGSNN